MLSPKSKFNFSLSTDNITNSEWNSNTKLNNKKNLKSESTMIETNSNFTINRSNCNISNNKLPSLYINCLNENENLKRNILIINLRSSEQLKLEKEKLKKEFEDEKKKIIKEFEDEKEKLKKECEDEKKKIIKEFKDEKEKLKSEFRNEKEKITEEFGSKEEKLKEELFNIENKTINLETELKLSRLEQDISYSDLLNSFNEFIKDYNNLKEKVNSTKEQKNHSQTLYTHSTTNKFSVPKFNNKKI